MTIQNIVKDIDEGKKLFIINAEKYYTFNPAKDTIEIVRDGGKWIVRKDHTTIPLDKIYGSKQAAKDALVSIEDSKHLATLAKIKNLE